MQSFLLFQVPNLGGTLGLIVTPDPVGMYLHTWLPNSMLNNILYNIWCICILVFKTRTYNWISSTDDTMLLQFLADLSNCHSTFLFPHVLQELLASKEWVWVFLADLHFHWMGIPNNLTSFSQCWCRFSAILKMKSLDMAVVHWSSLCRSFSTSRCKPTNGSKIVSLIGRSKTDTHIFCSLVSLMTYFLHCETDSSESTNRFQQDSSRHLQVNNVFSSVHQWADFLLNIYNCFDDCWAMPVVFHFILLVPEATCHNNNCSAQCSWSSTTVSLLCSSKCHSSKLCTLVWG